MTRSTHTYAMLDVDPDTFEDIKRRLLAVDYDHTLVRDGKAIDMHGIALQIDANARPSMRRGIRNFMNGIAAWMRWCFQPHVVTDMRERCHRFYEEAGELVQALGMTREEAHQLVDYTWDRPVGEPGQEVGGVMVTLAALCGPARLDLETEAWREYDRITQEDVMLRIRAKQAAKPKFGALPEHVGSLDDGVPNHTDHTKRGFNPK